MKRRIANWGLLTLGLALLPSCFVDQPAPKTNGSPTMPAMVGKILFMDNQGFKPQGQFLAEFAHKATTAQRAVTPRFAALLSLADNPRSGDCQVFDQSPSRDAQAQLISVGKLAVGHSHQDSFLMIPDNGNHQYAAAIPPGFESDEFLVYAEGAGDVPKFGVGVAVPPALTGVKLADADFLASAGQHLKKSVNLKLQWNQEVFPNSSNKVALQLSQLTFGNRQVVLMCQADEESLPASGGVVTWEITPSQLAAFPVAQNIAVSLLRANIEQGKAPFEVKLEGIRSLTTLAHWDP